MTGDDGAFGDVWIWCWTRVELAMGLKGGADVRRHDDLGGAGQAGLALLVRGRLHAAEMSRLHWENVVRRLAEGMHWLGIFWGSTEHNQPENSQHVNSAILNSTGHQLIHLLPQSPYSTVAIRPDAEVSQSCRTIFIISRISTSKRFFLYQNSFAADHAPATCPKCPRVAALIGHFHLF